MLIVLVFVLVLCTSLDKSNVVVRGCQGQDPVCLPVLLDGFQKTDWILDSAASQHITNEPLCLREVSVVSPGSLKFKCGDDQYVEPTHVGKVKVGNLLLSKVYLCKECPVNIVSEIQLLHEGVDIVKTARAGAALLRRGGETLLKASLRNGLFFVSDAMAAAVVGVVFNGNKLMDFHQKWGHLNFEDCLKELKMDPGSVEDMVLS